MVLMVGCYCRTSLSQESWGSFEGTFSLSTLPQRVLFYFEGPSPGVDLLIKSVVITDTNPNESKVILVFKLPKIFSYFALFFFLKPYLLILVTCLLE